VTAIVRDRGAADVLALVLITPACVALAMLVVLLGRRVDTVAQVRSAAESAAQAAALEREASDAALAADRVAARMLVDVDSCKDPAVIVDLSQFRPGGSVAVTVVCTTSTRGVESMRADHDVVRARAVARVDRFRADVASA
jgi:hypothetical protein